MLTRLDLRGVPGDPLALLPRPEAAKELPIAAVQAILADVRARGDDAVRECTRRFDGVAIDALAVPGEEIRAALGGVAPTLRAGLEAAHASIEDFHRHQLVHVGPFERDGLSVRTLARPVQRAGCYVPGGRASYPSTVLMTAVPARVAGVAEVVVCVPPGRDGRVAPATLAAAAIASVDEVYRIGGAQAVGAMAYGTETIRATDVIVGPGNLYVSVAQREVAGLVGVPSSFAGPSEVVVVADASTPVELAAIDVVVQAEHGPDGLAWLVTWAPEAADAISEAVERLVVASPRRAEIEATLSDGGYAVVVDGPEMAMAVANAIAPEHLELLSADPEALVPLVRNAGAVFTGPFAPASVGDYLAGPSHVLPTHGSARFASALTVDDFRKHIHVISLDEPALDRVGPHVVAIAEAEGLAAHADSVRLRGRGAGRTGLGPVPAGGAQPVKDPGPAVPVKHPGPAVPVKHPGPAVPMRDDLAMAPRYHSPQVEVEVRLNTNEAPVAPPPQWLEALREELGRLDLHRYPDRQAVDLRAAIGESHGVGPEQVFCANGSNEVLQCLLLAYGGPGRSVALFEPTYALHSHIARLTSTAVVTGERASDFSLDLDEVDRVLASQQPAITFLCSPNNPTGRAEPREVVEAVVAAAPGLVVVDEAYGQFAPWSALSLVAGAGPGAGHEAGPPLSGPAGAEGPPERLVVVRTFSKTWSMAGARLGYLVGPAPVVTALGQVALPYHLDTIKQAAGRLALAFEGEMRARVAALVEERGRLMAALGRMALDVWPSDANFVLFRPRARDGHDVWQSLLDRSVLVRDCTSWSHLEGCLRVTVGTPEENTRFLAALGEALG